MSGVLGQIRWPLFGKGELCGPRCLPRPKPNLRTMELQEAKEILGEVFGVSVNEVDDMIQRRLEERNLAGEESEERLWPERFCLESPSKDGPLC